MDTYFNRPKIKKDKTTLLTLVVVYIIQKVETFECTQIQIKSAVSNTLSFIVLKSWHILTKTWSAGEVEQRLNVLQLDWHQPSDTKLVYFETLEIMFK